MTLPISPAIENPVLHELFAVGGTDDVRFIYERLISYFPSLSDAEISQIRLGKNPGWKKAVQKAGKSLDEQKLISRNRGIWRITELGRSRVSSENPDFSLTKKDSAPLDHQTIQNLLSEIGQILGYYTRIEFEFYDVIWRESETSQRISHVFEVQSKGNIDSAFAKLKRAFDAQRSKPFLVLASERDMNRALKSLSNEFRELNRVITILSFIEIRKTFENLKEIETVLPKFLDG